MKTKCTKCKGSGMFKKADKSIKCSFCNGTGLMAHAHNSNNIEHNGNTYEKGNTISIKNKYGILKEATINYFFAQKGKLKGLVHISNVLVKLDFGSNNFETRQFADLI